MQKNGFLKCLLKNTQSENHKKNLKFISEKKVTFSKLFIKNSKRESGQFFFMKLFKIDKIIIIHGVKIPGPLDNL